SVRAHLDKPSVIRLTLSYIRLQTLLKVHEKRNSLSGLDPLDENSMYLKILEGFLMVLSTLGDMIFLSDNVSKYMGLSQTELMGHNIFEYTHPCDHEEIRHNLRLTAGWCVLNQKRDFVVRIKSALTHRGRVGNLKSTTWKVLHCQGRVKLCAASSSVSCVLLTCRPLPLSHTLLSTHTFTSQHSMDMRFTYCDQRVTSLLGYRPEELLGRSIYDLCHTLDTSCLNKNHLNLCLKSQSVSGRYRMLVRSGGYVWVESHSAVIPGVQPSRSRPRPNPSQPLCILCVTYILSQKQQLPDVKIFKAFILKLLFSILKFQTNPMCNIALDEKVIYGQKKQLPDVKIFKAFILKLLLFSILKFQSNPMCNSALDENVK
uniref:PAS domain-containing protein n=1 Tax=Xiphophorus maculatus TaxID=8083 RepID=M4ANF0_XIPMA